MYVSVLFNNTDTPSQTHTHTRRLTHTHHPHRHPYYAYEPFVFSQRFLALSHSYSHSHTHAWSNHMKRNRTIEREFGGFLFFAFRFEFSIAIANNFLHHLLPCATKKHINNIEKYLQLLNTRNKKNTKQNNGTYIYVYIYIYIVYIYTCIFSMPTTYVICRDFELFAPPPN